MVADGGECVCVWKFGFLCIMWHEWEKVKFSTSGSKCYEKKVFIARQEKNNIPEAVNVEVGEKEKIENKNKKFTIWWFLDKKLCVKGELFVVAKVFQAWSERQQRIFLWFCASFFVFLKKLSRALWATQPLVNSALICCLKC